MKRTQSNDYFKEAESIFPGGVNSPVRAFKAVGGNPLFIDHAQGAYLYDVDGNQFVDYVLSWGPMILGHAPKDVLEKVQDALWEGTSYGAPSPRLPFVERIRMVNSGTEATMSAIRLARGITKRPKVVKFIGCYHGHSDSFLVQAGSGVASFGIADSAGVIPEVARETIALPYNDLDALRTCFEEHGHEIACVIVEAIAGNMGLIPGHKEFIEEIRRLTTEAGSLFIIDEVMTGFRAHYQGAVGLYQVDPDLICLGKVIGGGFPVAAFGGKAQYMNQIAPLGDIYQAGTLSGNPIAMAAGYENLRLLTKEVFEQTVEKTDYLCQGIRKLAEKHGLALQVVSVGTMFGFFFSEKTVLNFEDSKQADHQLFAKAHGLLLQEGVYIAPSQYESNFLSSAHSYEDLDRTLAAFDKAFSQL